MSALAEQRMSNLERANEVRFRRCMLKQAVGSGRVRLVDVLADPPREVLTCPLGELLCWPRRWGPTRARRVLGRLMVGELKPVGSLTERQRLLLIEELAG